MRSKLKILALALVLSMMSLGAGSCRRGIDFDPHFYVPSVTDQAFFDRDNNTILFSDMESESLACLTKEKIMELKEILIKARMPGKTKSKLLEKLSEY